MRYAPHVTIAQSFLIRPVDILLYKTYFSEGPEILNCNLCVPGSDACWEDQGDPSLRHRI
jgi:hypothetical protein